MQKLTKMYWYQYNDTTFLNATKFPIFHPVATYMILKISKSNNISSASLPAFFIRPGCTSAMVPVFSC